MITGRLAAPSGDAPFSDGVIVEGRLAFLAGQVLSITERSSAN